jgi:hypothetical protein
MLYMEIIAVCSHIHTKLKYTAWAERRIVEFNLKCTYRRQVAIFSTGGIASRQVVFFFFKPFSIF